MEDNMANALEVARDRVHKALGELKWARTIFGEATERECAARVVLLAMDTAEHALIASDREIDEFEKLIGKSDA